MIVKFLHNKNGTRKIISASILFITYPSCEPFLSGTDSGRPTKLHLVRLFYQARTYFSKNAWKNPFAPPRRRAAHAALPRRKIAFPLRKKSARAKSKNDKAIFLLGSILTNKATGLRLRLAGKNFPPQTPPIFAYEPNKRSKNALWFFGAAGL